MRCTSSSSSGAALKMEERLEIFFGLQKDGKVNPNSGLPNPLQWAVISREYEDELYLPRPLCWCRGFALAAGPSRQAARIQGSLPQYSAAETARGEGAGQPSITMVVARAAAMATSMLVASIFLLGRIGGLAKDSFGSNFQAPMRANF